MIAAVLASGSKGNCMYVSQGSDALLIDAGISARALKRSLALAPLGAVYPPKAVFVTHEHCDHIRGLRVLTSKLPLTVYAPPPCAEYIDCETEDIFDGEPVSVGGLEVTAFPTPHDAAASCGYVVRGEGFSLGYATDLGYVTEEIFARLCSCRYVVLESNHDTELLKNGSYPEYLKARILSDCGHLSNDSAARCAAALAKQGVERIMLAHLSEENNRPELAAIASSSAIARAGLNCHVSVAGARTPTILADESMKRVIVC